MKSKYQGYFFASIMPTGICNKREIHRFLDEAVRDSGVEMHSKSECFRFNAHSITEATARRLLRPRSDNYNILIDED